MIRPLLWSLLLLAAVPAAADSGVRSRFFTSSDGVRLHFLEAGPPTAHTLVLVPGWTMPAWIFDPQLAALSAKYHVVAFDPRGQGDSDVAPSGYEPVRRGQDIAELIDKLGPQPVAVLGWSLGVLDTLAYVHTHGDARIAALILVDNSIGENPAPVPHPPAPRRAPVPREVAVRRFVTSMFRQRPSEEYIDELTEASLRTPPAASAALLSYPVPRTYWREAVYSTSKPILYAVRPAFAAQADNLERNDPAAETVVFENAGHAMFVDDPAGFDAMVSGFLHRRVWP
jgi:microsomal epoxide hydrolase